MNAVASPGEFPAGYSYLKDVRAFKGKFDIPVGVVFNQEQVSTRVNVLSDPDDIVFTATGPLSSIVDRAPVMIVRRKGNSVNFISIIEPVPAGKVPELRSFELATVNPLSVKISRTGGVDIVSFENEYPGKFSVTHKTASGETLVLKSENR
jgi:hypothetical protein